MFIQFDSTNRQQTRPQKHGSKAVSNDSAFKNALEQVEPPTQTTATQQENHKEPDAAPDYRSILMFRQF
tara:strand:+ start:279 stop:485 length:207 start_codon:yes stop_codon:yes gene_type:complete